MNIQITSVNMRYEGSEIASVQVSFQSYVDERTLNLSGNVPLTVSEYEGNESIVKLSALVRQKVSERFVEVTELK